MTVNKHCSNCGTSHGPLKRYMWNINHNFDFKEERLGRETQRKGKPILNSESGLLCDTCARKKGAWQVRGQEEITQQQEDQQTFEREIFNGINHIIDSRTN